MSTKPVGADERELSELIVQRVVLHHLDARFGLDRKRRPTSRTLEQFTPELTVALSAIANAGASSPERAEEAFGCGVETHRSSGSPTLQPRALLTLESIGTALDIVARTDLRPEQKILGGAASLRRRR